MWSLAMKVRARNKSISSTYCRGPGLPISSRAGASAARARPITLRAIAIEAGSISGRGQGSRLQASGGSLLHAALAPGAAPALTMFSRRGLHSGRGAVLASGARPAGGLLDFAQPGSCFLFSYHEPSGKPAAPNGHTRTASLNPLSGTGPHMGANGTPPSPRRFMIH